MKILALETSTELCSVALWSDGDVDASEEAAGQRHSQLLLPMVDALLRRHALAVNDLDGIAYGSGPGSFTGLRIACGVAQGLAYGAGLQVVGVSTLMALAEAAQAPRVVSCLDARMGEVYHAAYERDGSCWATVHEPSLCKPEAAPALPPGPWTGCGSGFRAYGGALGARYAGGIERVLDALTPHASEIAVLAALEFARGAASLPEHAAPLYVRNKVALRISERSKVTLPTDDERSKVTLQPDSERNPVRPQTDDPSSAEALAAKRRSKAGGER